MRFDGRQCSRFLRIRRRPLRAARPEVPKRGQSPANPNEMPRRCVLASPFGNRGNGESYRFTQNRSNEPPPSTCDDLTSSFLRRTGISDINPRRAAAGSAGRRNRPICPSRQFLFSVHPPVRPIRPIPAGKRSIACTSFPRSSETVRSLGVNSWERLARRPPPPVLHPPLMSHKRPASEHVRGSLSTVTRIFTAKTSRSTRPFCIRTVRRSATGQWPTCGARCRPPASASRRGSTRARSTAGTTGSQPMRREPTAMCSSGSARSIPTTRKVRQPSNDT